METICINGDVSKIVCNENFIKNYDADSDKGHILEVDIKYPKNFLNFHSDLPFLAERKKIKKCKSLFVI